jgi:acyl-CoA reductase-like NAD-dependent aldehyde dehydrogenase
VLHLGCRRHPAATVLLGGDRQGSILAPAVIADVDPSSPVSKNELFGPAVAVNTATGWDEAIALANDTIYGLSVGVFTSDLADAVRAIFTMASLNCRSFSSTPSGSASSCCSSVTGSPSSTNLATDEPRSFRPDRRDTSPPRSPTAHLT